MDAAVAEEDPAVGAAVDVVAAGDGDDDRSGTNTEGGIEQGFSFLLHIIQDYNLGYLFS